MALRRLAQTNNATTNTHSPRSPNLSSATNSPASSPGLPSTPVSRVSLGHYRSPASTPSISSSIPFDWEAARSRRPPPYPTQLQNKRKSTGVGESVAATPVKRAVIRKKGIIERSFFMLLHHASNDSDRLSGLPLFRLLLLSRLLSSLTMSPYHPPRFLLEF